MRRPLNYEILKYFTNVDKASAQDIYLALESEYKDHKAFNYDNIVESLMTAKENGLIDEDSYELIDNKLVVYYKASDEQKKTINYYIK
ncbi:hypothetical protein HV819_05855 [Anaerococcus sp. AGMB00486]|uniref:Uncharacterized protein n=2 Tax=Anaerococcus TaxID=165779 RepID=A0ABX2N9Y2_9FIRM|nr:MULTISPECIES: hypothetical protein [Anaerococcus]MDY3007290.1 hypothetical protein [Anaerococcus porci]MSS77651.1 hypothetical protein [Anaerococcus porci]NVF11506.1 hypothetical protein [Anaerococcus faecalis]